MKCQDTFKQYEMNSSKSGNFISSTHHTKLERIFEMIIEPSHKYYYKQYRVFLN